MLQAHFEPYIAGVVKQLVRAGRKQRLVAIPVTDALVMARLAAHDSRHAPGSVTAATIAAVRTRTRTHTHTLEKVMVRMPPAGARRVFIAAGSVHPGPRARQRTGVPGQQ
jgi:hypothetical protein